MPINKKIICVILLSLVCLSFGVTWNKCLLNRTGLEELDISNYDSELKNSSKDIYFKLEPYEDDKKIKIVLFNDSKKPIWYGEELDIEMQIEGQWYKSSINSEGAHFLMAHILDYGESNSYIFDVNKIKYNSAEKYRLIKRYSTNLLRQDLAKEAIVVLYFDLK